MEPITGLAYGRIVIGSIALVSPKLAARLFLIDPTGNRQLPLMTRLFGSREITLGALTLISSGEARTRLVQAGVAVDGADAVAGLAATVSGGMSKPAGLLFSAVAAGAMVTGVLELES